MSGYVILNEKPYLSMRFTTVQNRQSVDGCTSFVGETGLHRAYVNVFDNGTMAVDIYERVRPDDESGHYAGRGSGDNPHNVGTWG